MRTKLKYLGKSDLILFLLLLSLTILIRLPTLLEPWGADQAGFGFVAKGILEGKVPYRDFYSLTGYGVFFTFALFFKLFGMNMVSVHIGHLLVSLLTVILVFLLTHRLFGRNVAFAAAFIYTIFSNGLAFSGFGYENKSAWGTYWYLAQREVFMALLITGAVLLTSVKTTKRRKLLSFMCGLLIGLAAFYKVTATLMLFLFMGYIVYDEFSVSHRLLSLKLLGSLFALLLGFILINLPFLYYFWIHGALKDVYQALFLHVSLYARISRGLRIETLFSGHYSILSENLVLWLFSIISCLYIVFQDRTRNNLLLVFWTLLTLVMVWGQGKFFGYHFILLVPPFSILTAYGLQKFFVIEGGFRSFLRHNLYDIKKIFMLTTIILSIGALCISSYDYYKRHIQLLTRKLTKSEYYEVFTEFPTHPYSFRADYQVVQYLLEHRKTGDKLEVIFSAGDTIIHFLTDMEASTRFLQSWYLFPSDELLSKHKITVSLRDEFINQILEDEPRYILCVHIPLEELTQIPSLKDDPNVRKLDTFVNTNYELETFPDNRFLFVKKT
jgi:hypothetical protein